VKSRGLYERLIGDFARLPGVGHRGAQRLAFAILRMDPERARLLGETIIEARATARACTVCGNLTGREVCEICSNRRRDTTRIMVVEDPGTLYQIEHTGTYRGLYHVLAEVFSPLEPTDPSRVRADRLIARLRDGEVQEVILATSPTVEGEATALYLTREIHPLGIAVTRIAYGVPVGMELEYADEVSLIKSIEGRHPV